MNRCKLRELAIDLEWPACSDVLHKHHVLNKSLLKGNTKALRLVHKGGKHEDWFTFWVCSHHNTSRYADTKIGRAYLLLWHRKSELEPILADLRDCYKDGYPELTFDALTNAYRDFVMGDGPDVSGLAQFYREVQPDIYRRLVEGNWDVRE